MGRYIQRRLLQMIPVLFIVSAVIFLIVRLIPGDPARVIAGPNATPEQIDVLIRQFGLDKPIWQQYLIWLQNVLQGNMGYSYLNDYPVNSLILQRVPAAFELAFAAALIAVVIAFPLGIYAALRPGSLLDLFSTLFAALSFSIPGFWLALMFILVFSLWQHWLPPSGRPDLAEQPLEHFKSLLMPALTLGIALAAKLARYLRSSVIEVLTLDHVRTARGKGLPEGRVLVRHVLRNALMPVVTILGLQTGDLLSGSIIVESVFAWPGIGRLTVQAIGSRDYSLLQADVLYIVLTFLVINLITDLVYAGIDPRIRFK